MGPERDPVAAGLTTAGQSGSFLVTSQPASVVFDRLADGMSDREILEGYVLGQDIGDTARYRHTQLRPDGGQ